MSNVAALITRYAAELSPSHEALLDEGARRLAKSFGSNPPCVDFMLNTRRYLARLVPAGATARGFALEVCELGDGPLRPRGKLPRVCISRMRRLWRSQPCDGGPFATAADMTEARNSPQSPSRAEMQDLLRHAAGELFRRRLAGFVSRIHFSGDCSAELAELLDADTSGLSSESRFVAKLLVNARDETLALRIGLAGEGFTVCQGLPLPLDIL